MRASRRWILLILAGVMVLSVVAIGCGKEVPGTVSVAGSTTGTAPGGAAGR